MHDAGDDLALFMPLAGDDEDVAFGQEAGGMDDGFPPIGDLDRARGGGEDGGADGGGVFGARVVVGDDGDVGEAGGDLAHLRPFAGVAVTAAVPLASEAAATESPAEERKARYDAKSADVQNYYRVNRYPTK